MSQEWSLGYEQPRRKGKGAIIAGAVLMGLALVLGIVGIVGIASTGAAAVASFAAPITSPATSINELDGGTGYVVYELTGSFGPTITADTIAVTSTDGVSVPVEALTDAEGTYTSGSDTFVAVASFTPPTSGKYLTAVDVAGASFVVGPGLGALGAIALWGLLIGAATVVGIIGLIVLIVGLVRRSNSKPAAVAYPGGAAGYVAPAQPYVAPAQTPQPQIFEQPAPQQQPFVPPTPAPTPPPAAALPPAGWYPDPGRPGGQRYWDGRQWTEHQA